MHRAHADFWKGYGALLADIRDRADKQFALLRANPRHPSLQFKNLTERGGQELWSARVTLKYRALAVKLDDDYVWFWIGERRLRGSDLNRVSKRFLSPFSARQIAVIVSAMPRRKDIDLTDMTAEQELQSLLKWAEQVKLENVAAVLRRMVAKLSRKGSFVRQLQRGRHHFPITPFNRPQSRIGLPISYLPTIRSRSGD